MNNKRKAIVIGAVLLAATGTALAFGGPGNCQQRGGAMQGVGQPGMMQGMGQSGMMQGMGPSGSMQGIYQLENLSAEQRNQLQELQRSQRDTMRSMRNAMSDNHRSMNDAMEDGADSATIQKLAEVRGAAVATMTMHRAEMQKKVDAILTPEQRDTLANLAPSSFGRHQMGGRHGW
jgi:Spy/CpxP family protein refolding chaperone